MKRFLIYATLLFTLQANARNPFERLVVGLMEVRAARMEMSALQKEGISAKIGEFDNFVLVSEDLDRPVILAAAHPKQEIEILIGGSHGSILRAYDVKNIHTYAAIETQLARTAKKALVIASKVAKRHGLSPSKFFNFTTNFTGTNEGRDFTYLVFTLHRNLDAKVIEQLLTALSKMPY
ncbi:MAG: hypothetical protein SGJ18_07085 [Pseudomonadota bacterium]|nr:hypothetical protein [Pseudomonadota bacterium]